MNLKKKIYIILAIFCFAVLILAVVLIYPLLEGIKENSEQLITTRKELVFLEKQITELKEFKENYQEYKPNLEIIDKLFVDPETPLQFIQFLETRAANSNISLEISAIIPQREKTSSDLWDNTVFQISLKGSFSNFLRFLEKIEASSYLIESQNLTVNELNKGAIGPEGKSLGNIEANLSIKVFTK